MEFLKDRPYGNPVLNPANRTYELTAASLDQKSQSLESAEQVLRRDSSLGPKSERIVAVTDEIMLNALLSAPQVAKENQAGPASQDGCRFVLEWNENEIWIHGQDPFGLFLRENFQRSFSRSPEGRGGNSHGHAGRGLEIILSSSTDLYIKSSREWGTWVAARIDLSLSNRENDVEPKRLFLDFR